MNIEAMITNSPAPNLDCQRLCCNTNDEVSTPQGLRTVNDGKSNLNPLINLPKG